MKTNFSASLAGFVLAMSMMAGTASAGVFHHQGTAMQHHSKAKGALVGGAAGAAIGGKKGAIGGAVIGAEVQHHKNRKAEKAAARR